MHASLININVEGPGGLVLIAQHTQMDFDHWHGEPSQHLEWMVSIVSIISIWRWIRGLISYQILSTCKCIHYRTLSPFSMANVMHTIIWRSHTGETWAWLRKQKWYENNLWIILLIIVWKAWLTRHRFVFHKSVTKYLKLTLFLKNKV